MQALDTRIPSLVLRIEGAPLKSVAVTIDGETILPTLVTMPRALNPGEHEVVVKASGYQTLRKKVTLPEGQGPAVEVPVVMVPERQEVASATRADTSEGAPKWRTYTAIGGLGLAVVGLGVGVGMTVASNGKADEANRIIDGIAYGTDGCRAAECYDKWATAATDRNYMRGAAIAGYAVGGAALAGTAILWFTTSRGAHPQGTTKVAVLPALGGGEAGAVVVGAF
ncbi:PEGA domain-containing protein [Polyangium jinanense]|uniref:PEGA domain-containing protein n=1 Tax=Polyangium jinanense TaxID=2829994 RepID=UPI00234058FF|nr:PEGA domain-containing protein [Polyangium jinanense]MDC3956941.1 PEGA domain-containing protein [Polyangium jinanense]